MLCASSTSKETGMIAVIFEVYPTEQGKDEYLAIAAGLRALLSGHPGFIAIDRFQSLSDERKLLSVSYWENEAAVQAWRNVAEHRLAQQKGKDRLFERYRILVTEVLRDYTASERAQAPADSNAALA